MQPRTLVRTEVRSFGSSSSSTRTVVPLEPPTTDEEPQCEETDRQGCRLGWFAPILLLLSQKVNVNMRLNTTVFKSK